MSTAGANLQAPVSASFDGGLHELCRTVFDPLPRSDQRRWAAVYVRGLVDVAGRKSVRRIAEQVSGHAVRQCLQQFVNQSPWEWSPVRMNLAQAVTATVPTQAWVVHEIEFEKDGRNSVGVEVQYAPAPQRTVNCQLALSIWVAGEEGAVPANWRLMLPESWNEDEERRRKAHVPALERHQPRWQHILDAVDEMIGSWDLPPRPVVVDLRHERHLEPLLRGLEERGLRFAVRISDRTPVTAARRGRPPLTAADLVKPVRGELLSLPPDVVSRFRARRRPTPAVVAHAVVPVEPVAPRTGSTGGRPRRVLARWPRGRRLPGEHWVTNFAAGRMLELLTTVDIAGRIDREVAELRTESGLDHFEGRSFRGWHHHVTLASIAHAHRVLAHRELGGHHETRRDVVALARRVVHGHRDRLLAAP